MTTALVAGAANPIGRAVVEELAARGVPAIAHLAVEVAERAAWQKRLNFPQVRCDATRWETSPLTGLMAQNKPTHIFVMLNVGWTMSQRLEKRGLAAGNYEVNAYKLTEMLVDAMVHARHEAHIVYLSCRGASSTSSGEQERACGRAEQKIRTLGVPCTFIRVAGVYDDGPERPSFSLDQVLALTSTILYLPLRYLGARAFADRRRAISASQLARGAVEIALSAERGCRVVEGEGLRG
jgi:nucleoside-diphosphate-sugar epimerase